MFIDLDANKVSTNAGRSGGHKDSDSLKDEDGGILPHTQVLPRDMRDMLYKAVKAIHKQDKGQRQS